MENFSSPVSRPKQERAPQTYDRQILPEFLEQIDSGLKTLELRTAWDSWRIIKAGDYINFYVEGNEKRVKVKVLQVREYHTIDDVMAHEKIERIAPGMDPETAQKRARELFKDQEKHLLIFEIEKVS
ncbi:MAG TPA: hypothetical protein VEC13_00745 [Candidatus Paceibacterota bacterium]|nr:hypothetical protein [Candidatus Paceibacterota bacterium]